MNFRSRKLLDLAHAVHECQNCGIYTVEGCEPAHENTIEAGKGQSIKSRDNRHAALCHSCHLAYDSGREWDRQTKAEMWNRAHKRTFDLYWQREWIIVA